MESRRMSSEKTYLSPCATSASRARFPATTTRLSVSRASMLPPCHPIAFIRSGTTWKQIIMRRWNTFSIYLYSIHHQSWQYEPSVHIRSWAIWMNMNRSITQQTLPIKTDPSKRKWMKRKLLQQPVIPYLKFSLTQISPLE